MKYIVAIIGICIAAVGVYLFLSNLMSAPGGVEKIVMVALGAILAVGGVLGDIRKPLVLCDPSHLPHNCIRGLRWLVPMALYHRTFPGEFERHTFRPDPESTICDACGEPITDDQRNVVHECDLHEGCAETP